LDQVRRGGRKDFSNPDALEGRDEPAGGGKSGRSLGNQAATVGMLPPSSDSDSDEEEVPRQKKVGQSATAGMMPPNSSSEESESDDEPAQVQLTRREREQLEAQKAAEPDPEQMRKDMEKLALIRAKREADAAKRIAKDGWDRMKPMSESNHPPGMQWPPQS